MELKLTGRVWLFGNGINTDQILPTKAFGWPEHEQHRACFEALRPGWVDRVKPGDLMVAGDDFGIGSSRPIGAVLRACGIAGVIANSLNGLGLRSLINYSVPALGCPGVTDLFQEGDLARIDFCNGTIENLDRKLSRSTTPLAPELVQIVTAGGVVPMLIAEGLVASTKFVPSAT